MVSIEGRYFTDEEAMRGDKVAVMGYDIAHTLFPDGDAVDRTFIMDGAEYTVVGVSEKAKGGFLGQNGQTRKSIIPLKTARSRYPQVNRYLITCKARQGMRKDAYDDVEAIMRRIRHLKTGEPDDFSLQTPDQIVQQIDKVTGLIGLIAIAISGLGLLVGGIGVMNIMLVSVTERTREIGIRKALGARRLDIIGQFLAEAMALTSSGGLLGILVAVLITHADRRTGSLAAQHRARLGRSHGARSFDGRGPVFRHMAGGESGTAGSGGSAALRMMHL